MTAIASEATAAAVHPVRVVLAFSRREFGDAVASRWFALYTVAFAVLAVAVSFVSLVGAGAHGFAGFGKTAAGLLNLILLVVPLMALMAGAGAIAGERERGSLLYLLAQPISRAELLLGKFIGLSFALCASLCLGFGLSAGVLAWRAGGIGVRSFAALVLFTCLLAVIMLALGLLLSVLSRKTSMATGCAIFVWLTLVFLSDLGVMAGAVVFRLGVQDLFAIAIVNPLQAFKMAVIAQVGGSLDVLGPAGAYAARFYGDGLLWLLTGVLVAWGVVSLVGSLLLFARRAPV